MRPVKTRLAIDADFCQLSGEDATAIPFLAQGGHGCISVTSNVAPRLCADLQNAWAAGNYDAAYKINDLLMPLHDAMFIESSPGPVKYAAGLMGLCSDELRLPLCEIAETSKAAVRAALKHVGLKH